MELTIFFRFLKRNYKILLIIPLLSVVITYFLVKGLPDSYISEGQISTGIVDKSDEIDLSDRPSLQPTEIEQRFGNLIQMIQMQKIIRMVSYQLIHHDLSQKITFRPLSSKIEKLSPERRKSMAALAMTKYTTQSPLSRSKPEELLLEELISSMKYDQASLREKLVVYRIGQSDYINLTFESTDPELSAYVVNTLSTEFIRYYSAIVTKTGERSVNYLSELLAKKQADLNDKMSVLRFYKIQNNVLNLPEQARIVFGQMVDVEDRQAELQKEISSIAGAVKAIDGRFNPRERKYFEASASKINSEITNFKEKSRTLSDKYIDNNFDPVYKRMYDSLQILTTNKINESSDEAIFSPLAAKQDLIAKKIALQTELDLSVNSVKSMDRRHDKLFAQFRRLVPFEASIQSYERDIEIASQEYLDILTRYNQTSMQNTFIPKLKLSQEAIAGTLQPSKKMLLIILSGVISVVFCIVILFIVFYFDTSVQAAKQLADASGLPVIGQLDLIPSNTLNFNSLWNEKSISSGSAILKEQLRAIRFELNQELKNPGVLTLLSLGKSEGKTFLALNLAYAYAVTNKKVLLIDGNFLNPALSSNAKSGELPYIEDFLSTGQLSQSSAITILGNKGGGRSLLELTDQRSIEQRFDYLKSIFDVILIETPALSNSEISKEWILFSDKVLGVFGFKESISEDKKANLSYLGSLGEKFSGWVFNKLPSNHSDKGPKAK